MKKKISALLILIFACLGFSMAQKAPKNTNLKIVIIRHGEKPAAGDNLSCQGLNRANALENVLYKKIGVPDFTFIPSVECDKKTTHARMFQTVSPFAVKYNLTLDSKSDEKDSVEIAKHVLKKSGTVLLVWEHSVISGIARELGVQNPPKWNGKDFDSIWIITFNQNGQAILSFDKEGITPNPNCQ